MDSISVYKEAVGLLRNDDEHALKLLLLIKDDPVLGALANFHLGEIYNRMSDPMVSFQYHNTAFNMFPKLTSLLVKEDHPSSTYIYSDAEEIFVTNCPLCGDEGVPYATYNTTTSLDFLPGFNPIRVWMCCDSCHHLFAYNYPEKINDILTNSAFEFNLNINPNLFPINGRIMMEILKLAPGRRLLEVGVGAGEFAAVAKEFLFEVTGIDIRPLYSKAVSEMLGIPVICSDFQDYHSKESFDVLVMGDVIEHMENPISALKKAYSLLNKEGVLWISTPNFESAFSMVKKDTDPMWRIVEHLNYFSFRSLHKCLTDIGFEIVNYSVSSHYNGSMEITAVKSR